MVRLIRAAVWPLLYFGLLFVAVFFGIKWLFSAPIITSLIQDTFPQIQLNITDTDIGLNKLALYDVAFGDVKGLMDARFDTVTIAIDPINRWIFVTIKGGSVSGRGEQLGGIFSVLSNNGAKSLPRTINHSLGKRPIAASVVFEDISFDLGPGSAKAKGVASGVLMFLDKLAYAIEGADVVFASKGAGLFVKDGGVLISDGRCIIKGERVRFRNYMFYNTAIALGMSEGYLNFRLLKGRSMLFRNIEVEGQVRLAPPCPVDAECKFVGLDLGLVLDRIDRSKYEITGTYDGYLKMVLPVLQWRRMELKGALHNKNGGTFNIKDVSLLEGVDFEEINKAVLAEAIHNYRYDSGDISIAKEGDSDRITVEIALSGESGARRLLVNYHL